MSIIEIFILAFALAMDAFSVSIMAGLQGYCSRKQVLRMAVAFALFQFFMPIIGWFLALQIHNIIMVYDHWVAFILLAIIGGKMIWESRGDNDAPNTDPTKGITLLMLAIATSIDALAVGISFAALDADILSASIIIGLVCFAMTAVGMYLASKLAQNKSYISMYANILGGVLLISIGVKILFEHGVFG